MKKRSGEKAGWVAGWAGGFVWVRILALLFLYRQNFAQGLAGVALTGIAAAAVLSCAPWRHPSTPYWKLMLAPYGLFLVAVAWAVWSFGGPEPLGFNWWNLLWLMPALSPFGFSRQHTRGNDPMPDQAQRRTAIPPRAPAAEPWRWAAEKP